MKQKKSKQPKSKKSNHSTSHKDNAVRKKHGKQADLSELRVQFDQLGLKIIQVAADGNCFFRALADQLEGNEGEHIKYRNMVVQYILSNRENFEPFIEDEVPFDEYCQSMIKDGTWAGNLELQAASLVFKRNICIHRANYPRWYISNFNDRETTMIHLSYHDGEHYNSVRLQDDSCEGPAKPIVIKVDANVSAFNNDKKATSNESKSPSSKNTFDSESIKLVVLGTGCENINKVREVLQEVDGDVDSAIEYLIMERDNDMNIDKNVSVSYEDIGDDENEKNATLEDASINLGCEDHLTENDTQLLKQHSDDKGTSNKEISSDSRKKCKAPSSSTARKTSEAHVFNKSHATHRGKMEVKKLKKKEAARQTSQCPPKIIQDVGALRI